MKRHHTAQRGGQCKYTVYTLATSAEEQAFTTFLREEIGVELQKRG
jgi:hypothetical protein